MAKKNIQPSGVEVKDVTITSKQKTDLELVNQKIIDAKCRIADLTEQLIIGQRQIESDEQKRYSMYDEKYAAEAEYKILLSNTARLNGIDPDANPSETGVTYLFDGKKFIYTPTIKVNA